MTDLNKIEKMMDQAADLAIRITDMAIVEKKAGNEENFEALMKAADKISSAVGSMFEVKGAGE